MGDWTRLPEIDGDDRLDPAVVCAMLVSEHHQVMTLHRAKIAHITLLCIPESYGKQSLGALELLA